MSSKLLQTLALAFAVFSTTIVVGCGDNSSLDTTVPPGSEASSGSMMGSSPGSSMSDSGKPTGAQAHDAVLTGKLPLLDGKPQDLGAYKGKVVLVVNTASECGFTPQFDGLEKLYRQRKADGLVILGFPADDVAGQEPRNDQQIHKFCKANFGVTFPMFAKSNVLGDEANPLFRKLDAIAGPPGWNFNKYLLDRKGRVVRHFDVAVDPSSSELQDAITAQL